MQEKLAVVCKFGLGDEFMCNKPMLWKENKSYYSFKLQDLQYLTLLIFTLK